VQGIERLVDRFYYYMDALPQAFVIRAMHPQELGPVKAILVHYLTEWTGGPGTYSTRRGHPRLGQRHRPFSIGDAERDAWMTCMRAALADVIADAALRGELDAAFYRIADSLRNRPQLVRIQDSRALSAAVAQRAKPAQ
jgi:hemoglobin